ncbi:TIGR01620 family protein [Actinobacillus equuli]|uniref:TIGR01620 family protein n=1 Tax=Actinobacillus equuli TaxID=718 RepID=UPI002443570B|nr:TIGR01620 family protein [Actinobacillus equuli]WGE86608.1 YcjF family protein [Actinobacillus equuli subsp. haemolyticus]
MKKQIFSEQEVTTEQQFVAKQEFEASEHIQIEEEYQEVEAELIVEESLKPSRFWVRVVLFALGLFSIAVIAQSVQWLIDTFQARQWIYFAFAIVFALISLTGVVTIIGEWRKLVFLRHHQQQQQVSEQLLLEELSTTSGEKAVNFCNEVVANLKNVPSVQHSQQRWQSQLNEAYNAKEVLYLFSETVLTPLDKQVKKMISKSATENAVIVAVSPLAVVDVLMVAWRNIALVNKISKTYGMQLGYFSRLKLFKMVLTNMVFAGATEVVSDVGMEFFSQNLTAKLSLRAAQGIGVGLLTARLGIKAMEFCRPVAFQAGEKPKLSAIRQQLLTSVKNTIFAKAEEKVSEKV